MKRLQDKVAIVSAAANGIGRGISKRFAEEGAWVLLTDIDETNGPRTVEEIREQGGRAEFARVDIGSRDEIEHAVKIASDQFGRIDVLLNNAAFIGKWHDVLNSTDEEWDGCLHKTLLGTQNFTRAVLPWMIRQNRGSIIITSSINGTRTFTTAGASAYATSKAGQLALGQMAALELARYGIRVNVICPGAIDTEINDNTRQRNTEAAKVPADFPEGTVPLTHGRSGTSEEVAELVAFLASDRSRHITGTPVWIDGGQSLLV